MRKVIRVRGEIVREHDNDLLADLIWWLKGRASATESSDIDGSHLEALRKCRVLIGAMLDDYSVTLDDEEEVPAHF